ncbi:MAG: FkbM family methyltransferase [Verrucomicrobia bacterium]|nr:FkbM family methyltransferase [Verrucomicrobiota bacterium]
MPRTDHRRAGRLLQPILGLYQRIFARPFWQPFNRALYLLGLHGLGMLNYQNDRVSGERWLLRRLVPRLRPRPVILDVGAHFGSYSAAVKALQPAATVFAFEPNPTTFKQLQAEAQRAGFTAINKGCADKPGKLPLYDCFDNTASAHASLLKGVFEDIHHYPCVPMEVELTDLDGFAREQQLDHIDLLKIDAEGYELPILKGAARLIADGRVDVIQFEFGESDVVSRTFFRDFVQLLPRYRFHRLLCGGLLPLDPQRATFCEIFVHQNIVAFREDALVYRALQPA